MIASASFGPQVRRSLGVSPVMGIEDRVDHRPGGLNRVLAGEERSVACHGVA